MAFLQYLLNIDGELNNNKYVERNTEPVCLEGDVFRKYEDNRKIVMEFTKKAEELDDNNDYDSSVDRFALILTSLDYLYGFLGKDIEEVIKAKVKTADALVDNLREKIKKYKTKKVKSANNKSNSSEEIINVPVSKYYDKVIKFFETYEDMFIKTENKVNGFGKLGFCKVIGDKTLELRYRPSFGLEFLIVYTDEFGKVLTKDELEDYVNRCNPEEGKVKTSEVYTYIKEKFELSEEEYDSYMKTIIENLNEIKKHDNRIEYYEKTKSGASNNGKVSLIKIELPQKETTKTGEA